MLDVDGVLTDGSLWLMPGGTQVRKMNIRDGYALQLAIQKGYRILIISGAVSTEVTQRLQGLGLTDIRMGIKNKAAELQEYCNSNQIQLSEVVCMGDDVPDIPMLQMAGVACCPSDAIPSIRFQAMYVSPQKGGEGCVRDVIEKVMKLRGDWSEDSEIVAR